MKNVRSCKDEAEELLCFLTLKPQENNLVPKLALCFHLLYTPGIFGIY